MKIRSIKIFSILIVVVLFCFFSHYIVPSKNVDRLSSVRDNIILLSSDELSVARDPYLNNFSFEEITISKSLYDNPIQEKKPPPPEEKPLKKDPPKRKVEKPVKEDSKAIANESELDVENNSENPSSASDSEESERAMLAIGMGATKKLEYKPNFKIDKIPIYPKASIRLKQEGDVSLLITLNNSGEVLSVDVDKSTGHKLLDDSAIKSAKEWNYKQLLDGYTENYLVTTNIVFKLN